MAGASWYMLADRDPRRKISTQNIFSLFIWLAEKKFASENFFRLRSKKIFFFPKNRLFENTTLE